MATRPVLVCDRDGKEEGVQTYLIVYPDGSQWETDLCPNHAKPLLSYRENEWGRVPSKKGRRQVFEVTDLSKLAQEQKRARKRP